MVRRKHRNGNIPYNKADPDGVSQYGMTVETRIAKEETWNDQNRSLRLHLVKEWQSVVDELIRNGKTRNEAVNIANRKTRKQIQKQKSNKT